ncbi:MAG: ABC transporter ATP-binding protein [Alphaproteobacteria bacterium]|nr:ABC transporter ATP-binding protein [Alphaproteobacteria bacterium]
MAPLLAVEDLTLSFQTREGRVHALDRVSFEVAQGEMVGLVGESGSGKSVTAYAIADLLDPTARVAGGAVRFEGDDLLGEGRRRMAALRGTALAMIFQNPAAALNPIRPVGLQIADALRAHRRLTAAEAAAEALRMLATVKIPDPQRRAQAYPFELSGGTCQRVMIAIALACAPKLLIADEPTTGLDVTTQASIMDLLRGLAHKRGMATLFITHDLALAGDYCDRIVVMHAGQVVEDAPTRELFRAPLHPYTRKLIAATPRRDSDIEGLAVVPGSLPDLGRSDLPPCRYAGRCERHEPTCDGGPPPGRRPVATHLVACWRAP